MKRTGPKTREKRQTVNEMATAVNREPEMVNVQVLEVEQEEPRKVDIRIGKVVNQEPMKVDIRVIE